MWWVNGYQPSPLRFELCGVPTRNRASSLILTSFVCTFLWRFRSVFILVHSTICLSKDVFKPKQQIIFVIEVYFCLHFNSLLAGYCPGLIDPEGDELKTALSSWSVRTVA